MAEAASMASPVAGARILRERFGKRAVPTEGRPGLEPEKTEVSAPMSLLLSWTSPASAAEQRLDGAEAGSD